MSSRLPKHLGLALIAAVLAALMVAPAIAQAQRAKPPTLKVMTRNIYLGGNIFLPIEAQNRQEFEQKTQELWDQVNFTNSPPVRSCWRRRSSSRARIWWACRR